MEWLNKIPNWIKIPLKILLPSLTIFSGFLLLANDSILSKLYLLDFRNSSGFAFGLIFIVCLSLISCYILSYIFNCLMKTINSFKLKKAQFKLYLNLSQNYKEILQDMYKTHSHSLTMEISNASVAYLMAINAIGHSQVSTAGCYFDFFLQPWVVRVLEQTISLARKLIKKNSKLLKKEKNEKIIEVLKQEIAEAEDYIKYITTETDDEENNNIW